MEEESDVRTYETPIEVMGKLLVFTILMCSFPLITFFAFKWYIFEGVFLYTSDMSSIYATVPAIVAVNIVIASYIYVAWHSEPTINKTSAKEKKRL